MELRSWGSIEPHGKTPKDRPGKGIGKRDRDVREGESAATGPTGAMTWSAPSRPLLVAVGLVLLIVALRTRLRTAPFPAHSPQPESAFLSSAK